MPPAAPRTATVKPGGLCAAVGVRWIAPRCAASVATRRFAELSIFALFHTSRDSGGSPGVARGVRRRLDAAGTDGAARGSRGETEGVVKTRTLARARLCERRPSSDVGLPCFWGVNNEAGSVTPGSAGQDRRPSLPVQAPCSKLRTAARSRAQSRAYRATPRRRHHAASRQCDVTR
jgi:hypothetical protein